MLGLGEAGVTADYSVGAGEAGGHRILACPMSLLLPSGNCYHGHGPSMSQEGGFCMFLSMDGEARAFPAVSAEGTAGVSEYCSSFRNKSGRGQV